MARRTEHERVRRSDLRYALIWFTATYGRLLFVVVLMLAAGTLSVLGLLTWKEPFMRWSFAALCWGVAAYVGQYARRVRSKYHN